MRLLSPKIPSDVFSQHSILCDIYSKKSSAGEKKLDSEGKNLASLELIDENGKTLDGNVVFWPGAVLRSKLKISEKGWAETEEIEWEIKGE